MRIGRAIRTSSETSVYFTLPKHLTFKSRKQLKLLTRDKPRYDPESVEGKRANTYLADGFFGVLWGILGDLDYFCGILNLPRWSSDSSPCPLCPCTGVGDLTWRNCRMDAPWTKVIWTATKWLRWANRSKNPLFDLPGVTICTVALDYMHCKYLGSDQYMFGSVLALLIYHMLPDTPQRNLEYCWSKLKRFFKTSGTKKHFRYLNKLTMVKKKKGFPKLRGKAAEIKAFGPALLHLWKTHMNSELGVHRSIKIMLELNVEMERIMSDNKEFVALPEAQASL